MTLKQEVWQQDSVDEDLWEGESGLLVNTAALEERAYYFEVVRVPVQPRPAVEAIPGSGPSNLRAC